MNERAIEAWAAGRRRAELDHDQRPSLYELWQQAGGGTPAYDRQRYHDLMVEYGLIVSLEPGESLNLPCGWPHRGASKGEPNA